MKKAEFLESLRGGKDGYFEALEEFEVGVCETPRCSNTSEYGLRPSKESRRFQICFVCLNKVS